MEHDKNLSILSLLNIGSIEEYLKEILVLGFEYSSDFIFNYLFYDFRKFYFYRIRYSIDDININFLYLLQSYLIRNYFLSYIYILSNTDSKITFSKLYQILYSRGTYNLCGKSLLLADNLYTGINLQEFIFSSFSVRQSLIDGSLNTAQSGYLTRRLVECLRDIFIKEYNCNTKYIYKNFFIHDTINLPFFCVNNRSFCCNCLNILYREHILMSYNKGTLTAQALGEPSTQMLLRTFHLGSFDIGENISSSDIYYDSDFLFYDKYKIEEKFRFIEKILYNIKIFIFNNNKYVKKINRVFVNILSSFSFCNLVLLNEYFNNIVYKNNYFLKLNVYNILNINCYFSNSHLLYFLLIRVLKNFWTVISLYNYFVYDINSTVINNKINDYFLY